MKFPRILERDSGVDEEKPQPMGPGTWACIHCGEKATVLFSGSTMCLNCMNEKRRTGQI